MIERDKLAVLQYQGFEFTVVAACICLRLLEGLVATQPGVREGDVARKKDQ